MTREETQRAVEIMAASLEEGAETWWWFGPGWHRCEEVPSWQWGSYTYAVRRTGKLRPYTARELTDEIERRQGELVLMDGPNGLCPAMFRTALGWCIAVGNSEFLSLGDFATVCRWDNGDPCGVREPGEWLTMPGVKPPTEDAQA